MKHEEEEKKKKSSRRIIGVFIPMIIGILIIICLLVALGLWIGLTSQNTPTPKLYGQVCTSSDECTSETKLTCKNGICGCVTDFYMNGSMCVSQLAYNSDCVTTDECMFSQNLVCNDLSGSGNLTCNCEANHYWKPSRCEPFGTLNSFCIPTQPCSNSSGLSCQMNKCSCLNSDYYWNSTGSKCEIKKGNSDACQSSLECNNNLLLTCFDKTCQCTSDYYFDGFSCRTTKTKSSPCTNSIECGALSGLLCLNNICDCPSTTFWTGVLCQNLKNYGDQCTSTLQCNSTASLKCNTTASSESNCPISLPVNTCDCEEGQYYNTLTRACAPKSGYNSVCSLNCQCASNSNLECVSNSCQCTALFYHNGLNCVSKKTNLQSCTVSQECNSISGLACINSTCSCNSTYFWNNTVCVPKKTISASCSSPIECQSYNGLNCSLLNVCDCQANFYFTNPACVMKKSINQTCLNTYECLSNLQCVNSRCDCLSQYYWNTTDCLAQKTYLQPCALTFECNTSSGLSCQSSLCKCSKCNYIYNYATSACVFNEFTFINNSTFQNVSRRDFLAFTNWIDCNERIPIVFYYKTVPDTGSLARKNNYNIDPGFPRDCQQKTVNAYGSIYDRGHLVPINHFDHDQSIMDQTNYMTNLTPQYAQLNAGAWYYAEELTECLRDLYSLDVIGGIIMGNDTSNDLFVTSHGIRTPDWYWKIIRNLDNCDIIAWIMPNINATRASVNRYLVRVVDIEQQTGFYFPSIDNVQRYKLYNTSWTKQAGCDTS